MSVLTKIFSKFQSVSGGKLLDANLIEEISTPQLSTPALLLRDDDGNVWFAATPEGFAWKPLADIKVVADKISAAATVSDPALVLEDDDGNVWAAFLPESAKYKPINDLEDKTAGIDTIETDEPRLILRDNLRKVWAAFAAESCNYKPINDLQADVAALQAGGVSQWADLYPVGSLLHMVYYGQSLQAGRGASAISTSPLSYAYRYVGGVAAQDDIGTSSSATNHASLVAHIETDKTDGGRGANLYGETPAYGGAMMLNQLLTEAGFTMGSDAPNLLSSVPAVGGTSLVNLMDGGASDGWQYLTDDIAYGSAGASSLSKAYGGLGLAWQQGQADIGLGTSLSAYKANMITMRAAAEALMQAAEGNSRPLPVFIAQVAAHPSYSVADPVIARAQLQLCQEQDYFCLALPDYILTRQGDGLHIVAESELWMGAYFMLAAYRWCFLGQKPVPLVPTAQRLGARTIALTFPVGEGRKLEWDTTIVAAQTNYGFTAVNASDDTPLTISSVSIGGAGKVVYLNFSADLPTTAEVRYAWQSGDGDKGAGNLRDDDPLIFDSTGYNLSMHTWAPIFSLEA